MATKPLGEGERGCKYAYAPRSPRISTAIEGIDAILGHRASPQRKQGEPAENSMPCREWGKRNPLLALFEVALSESGIARTQTVFEPERLVPTAQGEVGVAAKPWVPAAPTIRP